MDKELKEQLELLKSSGNKEQGLEEHHFIGACLQIGLSISDIKELEYIDIAKIMVTMLPEDKKYKKATEEDWDRLM